MFQSMVLSRKYYDELEKLKKIHISAEVLHKNECQKCALCCWQRPCSFTKNDFETVVNYFNLTPEETFFKYFIVDGIGQGLMLLARRKNQEDIAGTYISCRRTYDIDSPCIFLNKNNECIIHQIKPQEGMEQKCWDRSKINKEHYIWNKEDLLNLGWDGIMNE